ncbi:hypothetical protein [Sorangium sp. So ce426]|uniref:hypothetical protein n=1 Tax=Sorangium sp. So ce426 TaxID=3133312 RepID=UPI003F5CA3E7
MTDSSQIQRVLMDLLSDDRSPKYISGGGRGFFDTIKARGLLSPTPQRGDVQEAMWSLVAQGLAYIDTTQPSASNWELRLTASGYAVLKDSEFNPHDPSGYIDRLRQQIPQPSQVVLRYMSESLYAFNQRLYLASTVMLGVASEAAFLELGSSFAGTLSGEARGKFENLLSGPGSYVAKFQEFRKRIEPKRQDLPEGLRDGMHLMLDSVLDLLRINRNEAGHPTGVTFGREDCFIALQMAARYMHRLYALKQHFEQSATEGAT